MTPHKSAAAADYTKQERDTRVPDIPISNPENQLLVTKTININQNLRRRKIATRLHDKGIEPDFGHMRKAEYRTAFRRQVRMYSTVDSNVSENIADGVDPLDAIFSVVLHDLQSFCDSESILDDVDLHSVLSNIFSLIELSPIFLKKKKGRLPSELELMCFIRSILNKHILHLLNPDSHKFDQLQNSQLSRSRQFTFHTYLKDNKLPKNSFRISMLDEEVSVDAALQVADEYFSCLEDNDENPRSPDTAIFSKVDRQMYKRFDELVTTLLQEYWMPRVSAPSKKECKDILPSNEELQAD